MKKVEGGGAVLLPDAMSLMVMTNFATKVGGAEPPPPVNVLVNVLVKYSSIVSY